MRRKPSKEKYYIGKKQVTIRKITIADWRKLLDTFENLPTVLTNVFAVPAKDRMNYLLVGLQPTIDDIIGIVVVLTGLDYEYIEQNADASQLTRYIEATVLENNIEGVIGDLKAVLGLHRAKGGEGND